MEIKRPFRNNLRKNDRVLDTVSGRQGKVATNPRGEGTRRTYVIFDGTTSARPLDVMDLRFVIDGKPEDVAPVDGEPGAAEQHTSTEDHATKALRIERETNDRELAEINARFKKLKERNERIDKALAALAEA